MGWSDNLGNLILRGLPSVLGSALPERWRRRAKARLSDFNPYKVIAGNHDLMRASRLAWVEAAFTILKASKESAEAAPHEVRDQRVRDFEHIARAVLHEIRFEALDRRTDPGINPIDRHLRLIIQGASEFVAPEDNRTLDQVLTTEFNATLAALTQWPIDEIPSIFGRIACDGLPTIKGSVRRTFGELVFAAFTELLKSPGKYPEALPAFNIAMDGAALKLTEELLLKISGLEENIDNLIADADALQIFKTGAEKYLSLLPQLLQGQKRIEALAQALIDQLEKGVLKILEKIEATAQLSSEATEDEINAEFQKLVVHLDRSEFEQVLAHKPRSLVTYRTRCIARWSQPRYSINKRFTPLTLVLDHGDQPPGDQYQKSERQFNDLREVLKAADPVTEPVLVITGAPGSGKSTLLRRLELDFASSALRPGDADAPLTILLPLNAFGQRGAAIPHPAAWIAQQWAEMAPALPAFDDLLGRPLLLLLDGLNEMPYTSQVDYQDRLAVWRSFLDGFVREHPYVRAIFTCRTLDYGEKLTTKELPRVPQVKVTPLAPHQVREFLDIYSPEHGLGLWAQLDGTPQLELYRSPFYLKLLIEQTSTDGKIPEGRAALFTSYVRTMLKREIDWPNPRFQAGPLFQSRDRENVGQWLTPHDLPARGLLFTTLAEFAFRLQERRAPGDKSQVRVDYDQALGDLSRVPDGLKETFIKAAADLQVLEKQGDDVLFVHQLLQEYFAARHLAQRINASPQELAPLIGLAQMKWLEADINPAVQKQLRTMLKSETLPDIKPTGWEETFTLGAAMIASPDNFLRALAKVNLPLAGRCAAQADVRITESLRQDLQQSLVNRSRDPATDLRARILAGNALGALGDPRFKRRQGADGPFLLPPMIAVDGGTYNIGSDEGLQKDEAPMHEVILAPFSLGRFPVTNAEFRYFIEARGYDDERWWATETDQRWRRGEGTGEGDKKDWRYWRDRYKSEVGLLARMAVEQAWPEKTIRTWKENCEMDDEAFEARLIRRWPNLRFTQPLYWNSAYNALNQPVVGVCWFEARAYCTWLSAQTGQRYRLPTEDEWEAAARGKARRCYAWGDKFDATWCNTVETKLRRTTAVGLFPLGDTPSLTEQKRISDLTGNVWEWTSSCYTERYNTDVGREDASIEAARVQRGGSWHSLRDHCRCACRLRAYPDDRRESVGFRLCSTPPIN